MISFASDYIAGAHPKVLRRMIETNDEILTVRSYNTVTVSGGKLKINVFKKQLTAKLKA